MLTYSIHCVEVYLAIYEIQLDFLKVYLYTAECMEYAIKYGIPPERSIKDMLVRNTNIIYSHHSSPDLVLYSYNQISYSLVDTKNINR